MKTYTAKLKQGFLIVAEVNGFDMNRVEKEIQHYAMVYSQDGAVEIIRNYELKAIEDKQQ